MDLLDMPGCSESSENDDDGADTDHNNSNAEGSTPDPPLLTSPDRTKHPPGKKAKKARRGSVDILPSSKAPPNSFLRSIPHRRGHWAGHVKIPVSSPAFSEQEKSGSIRRFQDLLEKHGHSGIVVAHETLHVSLSKYFSLQVAQIDSFVKRLSELVIQERPTHLHVDTDGKIMINEEGTRSFWCWTVYTNATLLRLVAHIDSVLASYNQPVYYKPPHFHISVASFPGSIGSFEAEDDHARESEGETDDETSSSEGGFTIPVTYLQCNLGTTKEYRIPLKVR